VCEFVQASGISKSEIYRRKHTYKKSRKFSPSSPSLSLPLSLSLSPHTHTLCGHDRPSFASSQTTPITTPCSSLRPHIHSATPALTASREFSRCSCGR
jgi:hypothetical protein